MNAHSFYSILLQVKGAEWVACNNITPHLSW